MVDEQKTRSLIRWAVALIPVLMLSLLLLVDSRYMANLFVHQAPFAVLDLLPWGWVILAVILGLVLAAAGFLTMADTWKNLPGVVKWLLRLTAVLMMLTGLMLVTLAPALLQLFRSGVWTGFE